MCPTRTFSKSADMSSGMWDICPMTIFLKNELNSALLYNFLEDQCELNLFMRSDGLNLLSLLTQWLFNKSVASWFRWALSLKWYFSLKFLISSFMEGIWRSCWITQFGTNHGVFTMILKTFKRSIILSMLEMLVVPHSWHLYSQTGNRKMWPMNFRI
jgi:hypothetical protein